MAEDQRVVFRRFLSDWGLQGPEVENLLTQAVQESWSPQTFTINIEESNQFKQSFPEITERRKRNLTPVTAQDVLNYRRTVTTLFRDAGLPTGFYDEPQDFVDLMGVKDIGLPELQTRISEGFLRVKSAPKEVRDAFDALTGGQGEGALAALWLDPERGQSTLVRLAQKAEIMGTARGLNFNISEAQAERMIETGQATNLGQATQGFEEAAVIRPLTEETMGETDDLTDDTAIGAAFGNASARAQLQRRQQNRETAFKGGGGAAQSRQGLGLGSS